MGTPQVLMAAIVFAASGIEGSIALAATVFGIALTFGGAIVIFRSKRTTTTIETLKEAMGVLEAALRIERTERGVENQRCQREIAILQGQVDVLSNGLAEKIAIAVVEHVDARQKRNNRPEL